jgi:hypothetical protein
MPGAPPPASRNAAVRKLGISGDLSAAWEWVAFTAQIRQQRAVNASAGDHGRSRFHIDSACSGAIPPETERAAHTPILLQQ